MTEKSKIICTDTASGSITLKEDEKLKIQFDLTLKSPIPETDVIKVHLLAKDLPPFNVGTAHMMGRDFSLSENLCLPPEYKNAITGASVIRKNVFTEEITPIITTDFKEDETPTQPSEETYSEQVSEIYEKLTYLTENPAYSAYLSSISQTKSPIEKCADILDDFKRSRPPHSSDAHKICLHQVNEHMQNLRKIKFTDGFEWYVSETYTDFGVSAISHILSSAGARDCFESFRHFLVGINIADGIVCIAIPTEKGARCPISQVDDCCTLISPDGVRFDYYIAGISLEEDGQYFIYLKI